MKQLLSPRRSFGPVYLGNEDGGCRGVAEQQEQECFSEPDHLEHPAADLLKRQHFVGAQVRDPVFDDAGLEQRAENGVHRLGQVRAAGKHELRGVRAQQTAGQKSHGYLDLNALGLWHGIVVHEPFDL